MNRLVILVFVSLNLSQKRRPIVLGIVCIDGGLTNIPKVPYFPAIFENLLLLQFFFFQKNNIFLNYFFKKQELLVMCLTCTAHETFLLELLPNRILLDEIGFIHPALRKSLTGLYLQNLFYSGFISIS